MRESTVTRLGEGVEASGRLGEQPRQRVFAALERYAGRIREQECDASAAVMTSAVRDAANGAEFSAAVRERFGLEGRTLSGDAGGRVHLRRRDRRAARGRPDRAGRDRHRRRLDRAGLRRRRPARLPRLDPDRRRAPQRAPPARGPARARASSPRSRPTCDAGVAAAVPASVRDRVQAAVAVAGHGDVVRGDRPRARALRHDEGRGPRALARQARRPARAARRACRSRERREVRGLHPDRAPTIVAGVVVLSRVLDAFGLGEVEVSDRDILWGVALELARCPYGHTLRGDTPYGVCEMADPGRSYDGD